MYCSDLLSGICGYSEIKNLVHGRNRDHRRLRGWDLHRTWNDGSYISRAIWTSEIENASSFEMSSVFELAVLAAYLEALRCNAHDKFRSSSHWFKKRNKMKSGCHRESSNWCAYNIFLQQLEERTACTIFFILTISDDSEPKACDCHQVPWWPIKRIKKIPHWVRYSKPQNYTLDCCRCTPFRSRSSWFQCERCHLSCSYFIIYLFVIVSSTLPFALPSSCCTLQ